MRKLWWLLPLALLLFTPSSTRSPIDRVERIADAIANAEGYYVPNSRARRNNNPGDLTTPLGQSYTGYDGQFVVFATDTDGWNALYILIADALNGVSGIYNADMSISEFATHYTATEQAA